MTISSRKHHNDFYEKVFLELENEKLWEERVLSRRTLVELITAVRKSLAHSSKDCAACSMLRPVLNCLCATIDEHSSNL
jgi:hypothetical protein